MRRPSRRPSDSGASRDRGATYRSGLFLARRSNRDSSSIQSQPGVSRTTDGGKGDGDQSSLASRTAEKGTCFFFLCAASRRNNFAFTSGNGPRVRLFSLRKTFFLGVIYSICAYVRLKKSVNSLSFCMFTGVEDAAPTRVSDWH